jgi:hypothetical protein
MKSPLWRIYLLPPSFYALACALAVVTAVALLVFSSYKCCCYAFCSRICCSFIWLFFPAEFYCCLLPTKVYRRLVPLYSCSVRPSSDNLIPFTVTVFVIQTSLTFYRCSSIPDTFMIKNDCRDVRVYALFVYVLYYRLMLACAMDKFSKVSMTMINNA